MTDKLRIIRIYVVVAVISVLILLTTYYIQSQQVKPKVEPYYAK